MTARLRGALLTLTAFGAVALPTLLAACSDNGSTTQSTTVAFNTIPNTTTTSAGQVTTTTAPPDIAYVVQRDDALTKIADDYCTTAGEIAALNQWRDGLQHVILPGQTIMVPGPGCPVPSTSTTTIPTVMNKYLALYVNERVVTDPFDQNTADHVNWGTTCYSAYWAAQAFATQGSSKADLLAALDPLPGAVPTSVLADVDRWLPFTTQWFPVYTEIISRIRAVHPMYPDTDTYYRVLLDDPEYLSLLAAWEPVANAQFTAKYYVSDLCTNLFATKGSTP